MSVIGSFGSRLGPGTVTGLHGYNLLDVFIVVVAQRRGILVFEAESGCPEIRRLGLIHFCLLISIKLKSGLLRKFVFDFLHLLALALIHGSVVDHLLLVKIVLINHVTLDLSIISQCLLFVPKHEIKNFWLISS